MHWWQDLRCFLHLCSVDCHGTPHFERNLVQKRERLNKYDARDNKMNMSSDEFKPKMKMHWTLKLAYVLTLITVGSLLLAKAVVKYGWFQ